MADAEGNEGKNLAKDRKDEQIKMDEKANENKDDNEVVYDGVEVRLNRLAFDNKIGKQTTKNEKGEDVVEYNIYVKFKDEDIKIATINPDGTIVPNRAILENDKYTEEDKKNLGNMLNLLGLENGKVDVEKIEKALELAEKEKEEQAKNKEEKEEGESIKDEEKDEDKEEKKEKEVGDLEKEGEQKTLAEKMHINPKNVCKIRRDSQFYKNYPSVPRTAFFYLDENDKMHAKYVEKDGSIQDLPGFTEIQDRTSVVRLGTDGQNIKEEIPYRVMSAEGLHNNNKNVQGIRIAMYKDQYGYLELETIQQGRNGKWEGKNIDTYGRELNTAEMNRITDERTKTPNVGGIAQRHEQLKNSGFSEDGITLDELSKRRKIDEYMQDGYTAEQANKIYEYVVGEKELTEDKAKETVNEEIAQEGEGRTPGEDAYERLSNRH